MLTVTKCVIDRISSKLLSGWIVIVEDDITCKIESMYVSVSLFDNDEVNILQVLRFDISSERSGFHQIETSNRYRFTCNNVGASPDFAKLLLSAKILPTFVIELAGQAAKIVDIEIWEPILLAQKIFRLDENMLGAANAALELLDSASLQSQNGGVHLVSRGSLPDTDRLSLLQGRERVNCCVLTCANGASGYWPFFYRYYSKYLGAENIFLFTNKPHEFAGFKLGGLISTAIYDDRTRAYMFAHFRDTLAGLSERVLVCDVDEILVPFSPSMNLGEWIHERAKQFTIVYPIGIDVIFAEGESNFSLDVDVADQRSKGIYNSNLSKPNLFPAGTILSPGHHFCSVNPSAFTYTANELICFHLKYACPGISRTIARQVSETSYGDSNISKYALDTSTGIEHPALKSIASGARLMTLSDAGEANSQFVRLLKRDSFGLYVAQPKVGKNIIKI